MKLTQEQCNQYLRSEGAACPYCGSKDIDAGHLDADGDFAVSTVTCADCGEQWEDGWKLVSIDGIFANSQPANDNVKGGRFE